MRLLALLAVTLLAMGCTADAEEPRDNVITRADLGEKWPLTVDEVELGCEDDMPYIIAPDGTKYALTGYGYTHGDDLVELDADNPLWADNPSAFGGPKVSIKPLTDAARKLCG